MNQVRDQLRAVLKETSSIFPMSDEDADRVISRVLGAWQPVGDAAPAPYVVTDNALICEVAQSKAAVAGPGLIAPSDSDRTCTMHVDAINRVYRVGVDHGQKISSLVEDPAMRSRVSDAIDRIRISGTLIHSEKIDMLIDAVRGKLGGTSTSSVIDGREIREAMGAPKPSENGEWTWNHAVSMVRNLGQQFATAQTERAVARKHVGEVIAQRERCDRKIAELEQKLKDVVAWRDRERNRAENSEHMLEVVRKDRDAIASKLHGVETSLSVTQRDASNRDAFNAKKLAEGTAREVELQRMIAKHADTIDQLKKDRQMFKERSVGNPVGMGWGQCRPPWGPSPLEALRGMAKPPVSVGTPGQTSYRPTISAAVEESIDNKNKAGEYVLSYVNNDATAPALRGDDPFDRFLSRAVLFAIAAHRAMNQTSDPRPGPIYQLGAAFDELCREASRPSDQVREELEARDQVGAMIGVGPKPRWSSVLAHVNPSGDTSHVLMLRKTIERERADAKRWHDLAADQAMEIRQLLSVVVAPPKPGAPIISSLVYDAVKEVIHERGLPLDGEKLEAFSHEIGQRSHAWICDYRLHNPRSPEVATRLPATSIQSAGRPVQS